MRMANVILFHSILGLRPLERDAAERLRAAGHSVTLPDLYDGRTETDIDRAFGLRDEIGWETICARAEAAAAPLPPDGVLAGVSMGAGVAAHLWPQRPDLAGLLLLHGVCEIPDAPRRNLPVQVHLAEPDAYEEEEWVVWFRETAGKAGLAAEMHRYPGAGHLFTDPALPGHDPEATRLLWDRSLAFLAAL
jgi:dienelactone hydrolase